jgi:Phospholipase D C terminal
LDGARDTEIAALMWQPQYVASGSTGYGDDVGKQSSLPQGDIAAFRCGLWSSHLGTYYPQFQDPSSLECVRLVRDLAGANFKHFAAEGVAPADMPHGHLALYPYVIDQDGEVTTSQEHFPDFPTALIKGKAGAIPNIVTG